MPAKKQKYNFLLVLQCLLSLLLWSNCLSGAEISDPPTPPLALDIDSSIYFQTLENCIKNSKKNILILLSGFSCNPEDSESPVARTIKALMLARYEGIPIDIVMNSQAAVSGKTQITENSTSDPALDQMKNAGINLHEIETSPIIESTLVIIDERWILEGSQPWSSELKSAPCFYSSTLIDYAPLAMEKIRRIHQLMKKNTPPLVKKDFPGRQIFFPVQLADPKTLNRFIKIKNSLVLDLYLSILLKQVQKQRKVCLYSMDNLASFIISSPKTKTEKEKIIRTFLKTLKKWNLLEYKILKDGNCSISIPQPASLKNVFPFPMEYFLFNCKNYLSLENKCIYLLLLCLSHQQDSLPLVKITPEVLSSISSIKPERFSLILENLEKNLLITPLLQNGELFYEFQQIPNRAAILKTLELMNRQYGEEKIKKTQILASQFNQELNPQTLSDLIYYERELGLVDIQKTIHSVLSLPKGHPARTFKSVKKGLISLLNQRTSENASE